MDLSLTQSVARSGFENGLHSGVQIYVSRGAGGTVSSEAVSSEAVSTGAVSSGAVSSEAVPFEFADLVIGERAEGLPMEQDSLNIWLSSTKPVTAVAFALLWQRGDCDLDDKVARFVPEFAAQGKGEITLRHILTHTGGIRMLNIGWPEASWEEIIDTICRHRPEPRWEPGEKAGYHMASSWFVLGEVVARIAGERFDRFVRREVLEPCGMHDSWIGMPEDRFAAYGDRIAHMYGTEKGQKILRRWHEAPSVVGCSPGGNGRGPIRDLGKFYEMLLRKGLTADGQRLLTPQTVEALTTPQRVGMQDQTFKQKLDWGLGFIVDSKHYGEQLVAYGYGASASRRTFGHSGFQSSTGFADPKYDLVVAMVANGQPGEPAHTRRFKELAEAVYADLGLAPEPQSDRSSN